MSFVTKKAGFTLIEVLAALMIFSFAIVSLSHAGSQSLRTVIALEQKTYAGIVADNQLVWARHRPLVPGQRSGNEQMAGRWFAWTVQSLATDRAGFYRLVVEVRAEKGEQVLVSRTAFKREN